MASLTLLGPRVIRLPFIFKSSYPHEILHNWWGNGVYVDYASGNWPVDALIMEQKFMRDVHSLVLVIPATLPWQEPGSVVKMLMPYLGLRVNSPVKVNIVRNAKEITSPTGAE